jgi:hypothetical protein
MTLEARPYASGVYPMTLLDTDTGHVFGHATSHEALRALVRLVWMGEERQVWVPPVGGVVMDAIARIRARRGR